MVDLRFVKLADCLANLWKPFWVFFAKLLNGNTKDVIVSLATG
jgi:hypothetical protein